MITGFWVIVPALVHWISDIVTPGYCDILLFVTVLLIPIPKMPNSILLPYLILWLPYWLLWLFLTQIWVGNGHIFDLINISCNTFSLWNKKTSLKDWNKDEYKWIINLMAIICYTWGWQTEQAGSMSIS